MNKQTKELYKTRCKYIFCTIASIMSLVPSGIYFIQQNNSDILCPIELGTTTSRVIIHNRCYQVLYNTTFLGLRTYCEKFKSHIADLQSTRTELLHILSLMNIDKYWIPKEFNVNTLGTTKCSYYYNNRVRSTKCNSRFDGICFKLTI